ncbi:MAG: hypothetical protein AABZ47_10040 [Planctomycetota bacterium]
MRHCFMIESVLFLVSVASLSPADIIVPGADGSDGPFTPTTNVTVDLSAAIPRVWDSESQIAGRGVYDYDKWAVVFKYASVSIPANVSVTFTNHPSRAPVVWLVDGDVTINGNININGKNQNGPNLALSEPGPGGFRGGHGNSPGNDASAGYGPGGGGAGQHGGSYAPTYGNLAILPLIGGSSGGGQRVGQVTGNSGGGAGGGALLIIATGTITGNGTISANGGSGAANCTFGVNGGGGSGGGIRLVADRIIAPSGSSLQASGGNGCGGGNGSVGRIRLEANQITLGGTVSPAPTQAEVGDPLQIWADMAPRIRISSVGTAQVPTDPRAGLDFPGADAILPDVDEQLVVIEGADLPLNWLVDVRMLPRYGPEVRTTAILTSGDFQASIWHATLPIPDGFAAIQARAYDQTAATANGEEVEQPTDSSTADE